MRDLTQKEIEKARETIREKAYEFAEKAQPLFAANNWTWALGNFRIPTVDDIYLHVLSLSRDLKPGNQMYCMSSGRIAVRLAKYHQDEIAVIIELVPTYINFSIDSE